MIRPPLSLVLLSVVLCSAARAASPSVRLRVDCEGVSADEVRRIAGIELKLPVLPAEAREADVDLAVRCQGALAELSLKDGLTAKSVERQLDVSSTPLLARARLLALSITELLSASWAELELSRSVTQTPRVRDEQLNSARAAVRVRRRRGLEGELQAQGNARLWSSAWSSAGPGLRLQLGYPLTERWALAVASGASAELGSRDVSIGMLRLRVLDATLVGLLEARLGAYRFAGGAGLRGGLLQAEGEAADPTRVSGHRAQDGYAGTLLTVRSTWSPFEPFCVSVAAEGGWAFRAVDVRVLGESRASAGQSWLGASLGLGVTL